MIGLHFYLPFLVDLRLKKSPILRSPLKDPINDDILVFLLILRLLLLPPLSSSRLRPIYTHSSPLFFIIRDKNVFLADVKGEGSRVAHL